MADSKVTDMIAATSVNPADVLYCVQNGIDKQLTISGLLGNLPNTPAKLSGLLALGGTAQNLNNAGAITVTQSVTLLSNSVGTSNALTIANGSHEGQIKTLIHTSGTGTSTLSGTNVGASSIVFNKPGHTAILMWGGNKWWVLGGTAIITV